MSYQRLFFQNCTATAASALKAVLIATEIKPTHAPSLKARLRAAQETRLGIRPQQMYFTSCQAGEEKFLGWQLLCLRMPGIQKLYNCFP